MLPTRLLIGLALVVFAAAAPAVVPEHSLENGAVRLAGVGPDNPILYDNDWWFDVFDNNYLWAQASLGAANLRGNIVSRDMWDWEKGYHYSFEQSWRDAEKALKLARDSGLRNIPDLTRGADQVLTRPESGRIEDTVPHPSDGSRLIVAEAKKASPEKPLLVVAGGPLTTVANALLTNPEIASNLVVFNLTVSDYGYNGKDGWAAYIVAKRTRYVDWGGGAFWDRDSVFTAKDFEALPDNPFTQDMKRFIKTDLGRANQLGDGAPLVWLWAPRCWTGVEVRRAEFQGRALVFRPVPPGERGDVLVIPKSATDLKACHEEFFRVLAQPAVYGGAITPAKPSSAPPAVKLWPQLTDGIINHAGRLAMRCVVAEDGLTVTDTAWDTYQVPGCGKRWTVNMGAPMSGPLRNFTFPSQFAGLPVNLTVEFFNPDKPWEVKENYQEILLLGGRQTIGLPDWFRVPTKRLAYDFDEGDWFPSGWKLPRGKYALWQGAAKARQQDRGDQCPMYDFGFTHVSPAAMTPGGDRGTRERRAHLFGDNEWIPHDGARDTFSADPTDPKNWQIEPWHHRADECAIMICNFEAPNYHAWGDHQYEAFGYLIREVRARRPDTLVGCWGVGVLRHSFRIFDSLWEGKPTGVTDRKGAQQWRQKYEHPEADLHPVFTRCGLNVGNPSVYWLNNSKPSQLYAFVQEWEQGKLARPEVPNILSTWIQVEFVDGYPLSPYRFTDARGRDRREDLKHQVPASATYALSLFGHCVMDGLQCWEIGARYSEDLADYSDWRVREHPPKHMLNGVETPVYYYLKYFGFYNFHVLGMWQASQHKEIIEADTRWEMPELWTSRNQVWRTGDERYPSFVNLHKEPLVRVKLSADGKELLVIACNPHNQRVEQVRLRRPGSATEYSLELVGDFPVIRQFPTKPANQ